jgi:acyl carrier protein
LLPTTTIRQTVATIVTGLVDRPATEFDELADTSLLDLGVDSLRLVRLVGELENVFGVAVPNDLLVPAHFGTARSVCDLVATCLRGPVAATPGPAAVPVRDPDESSPRVDDEPAMFRQFPVEGRLLTLTGRTRMTRAQVAQAAAILGDPNSGLDWARFVDLAGRHRVLNLVARSLERERIGPSDPVRHATLRSAYLYNANRNRALLAELRLLLAEFANAGINAVLRKGTYLSTAVYPDPALRFMVDMDIFVPGRELDRYAALMSDLGYQQGNESANGRVLEPLPREEEVFSRLHESGLPPFWRLTSDPYVDIFGIDASHDLMPPTSGKSLPAEDLLERATRGRLAGEDVWLPSDEDMLLDLGVHLYREATWLCSIENGKDICLIRFLDIVEWYRAAEATLDLDRVITLARRYDLAPELYYGLHFTDQLYPGVLDAGLLDRLRPDDLGYLDEYGRLDRRPRRWTTSFPDRVFDTGRQEELRTGAS